MSKTGRFAVMQKKPTSVQEWLKIVHGNHIYLPGNIQGGKWIPQTSWLSETLQCCV